MEVHKALRRRINVSQTSAGKKSWDTTIDAEGYELKEVLAMSDEVVAEMEKRYPCEVK